MIRRNQTIFRFAFIGTIALSAVITAVAAASALASDTFKTGAEAEWYPARTILMHMPDEEIFLGVTHPAAALFEKSFSLQEAQGEFINYVKNLTEQGAEVIRVKDVLLDGTLTHQGLPQPGEKLDELRAFASEFLQIDTSKLPPEMRQAQEEYKSRTIANLSPQELVRIILLRPTVILEQTDINTEFKAKYEEAPLMNLYFCRDQMITTAKGIVIAKMNSTQRADETKVLKFVLKKLGVKPIYEVTGEGRLEGGDYFSAGDVAMIGQGLRTNPEGVRQLLEHQVFGTPKVAVVKDSWENQEQMHLDTYFNIIGPKLAVLVDMRMNLPDKPASPDITTLVDLYELQDGKYVKTISDRNFQDWLETDLGFQLIPVSRADQNRYAINFLAVRANRIMAIDGASRAYKQALRERGVDATWMDFSALTAGYGAAHCMTQVIRREKPIDADMTNVMMGMGKDFCVICLESITDVSERRRVVDELARMGKTIIPITLEQVSAMCGNIIELRGADDARVILLSQTAYNSFTDEQKAALSSRGTLCPVEIPTLESIGGGSARCMVAEIH